MKTRKPLVLCLAALPLLGLATGCGNKVDNRPGFTFWYVGNKDVEARLLKQAANFESIIKERDGIDIHVRTAKYGDYSMIKDKLDNGGFTTGNVPTLAVAYPDHVASYMELGRSAGDPQKYVWKLDDFFTDPEIGFGKQPEFDDRAEYNLGDFIDAYMEEGTRYIESGTYSIPFAKSTELMYYNVPLLQKYYNIYPGRSGDLKQFVANLDWAGFMDLCQFIREDLRLPEAQRQVKNSNLEYVVGYDSDANMFITRLMQQNIPYTSLNATKNGIIDFAKDVNKTAYDRVVSDLQGLRALHQDRILITKLTNNDEYSSNLFTEQQTLFTIGSSGGSDYNTPKGNGFAVDVSRVPPVDSENAKYVTQGITFAFLKNPTLSEEKNTENVRYAWQFAKYITNPIQNLLFCQDSQGYFPVRKSALETDDWEEMTTGTSASATAYRAIVNQVKHKYFSTALFQGCAELRTLVGSLLAQSLISKTGDAETIGGLVDAVVREARKQIK